MVCEQLKAVGFSEVVLLSKPALSSDPSESHGVVAA